MEKRNVLLFYVSVCPQFTYIMVAGTLSIFIELISEEEKRTGNASERHRGGRQPTDGILPECLFLIP